MRTLVGAAEPPERRPAVVVASGSSTGCTADVVVAWLDSADVTVTPRQAVVIRHAYASPTVHIGE